MGPGGNDYAALTHAERVRALLDLQSERARLDADEASLLTAIKADPTPHDSLREIMLEKGYVAEEVALALRVHARTAADRIAVADELVRRLPATHAAMRAGQLPAFFARHLVHETSGLPDDLTAKVEAAVLEKALDGSDGGGQSYGAFRRAVAKAVLACDPLTADERHEQAMDERRAAVQPDRDGMSWFNVLMGAHATQSLWNRLCEAARLSKAWRAPGDDRTMDQRRADIMAGLGILGTWTDLRTDLQTATDVTPATVVAPTSTRADTDDHVADDSPDTDPTDAAEACSCGGSTSKRPTPTTTGGIELRVSIAFSTLLGVDDQPGELDGYGPIPAAMARTIAFGKNTVWRRLVTDDLGQLVDYGTTRYRPPRPLDRHVRARDQHCRAYGCYRRAVTAELDHVIPFARGGPTNAANLEPLCSRDHDVKHEAGWQVTRQPDGTTVWTTPGGIVRTVAPATYPVDTTSRLRRRPPRIVVDQWWPHAA